MSNREIRRPHGASTCFLLIHGFCDTTDAMVTLADYLEKHQIASYSVLLAGHGTSPENLASTTWSEWYESVVNGLEKVLAWEYQQTIVAGLSLGSALSLLLAAKQKSMDGIVLLAPLIKLDSIALKFLPLLKHLMSFRSVDVEEAQQPYDVKRFKYNREPLSAYEELQKLTKSVREHLPQVTVPTLIIQGTKDTTLNPDYAEEAYQEISAEEKKLLMLPGAEHVITCHPSRKKAYPEILDFVNSIK